MIYERPGFASQFGGLLKAGSSRVSSLGVEAATQPSSSTIVIGLEGDAASSLQPSIFVCSRVKDFRHRIPGQTSEFPV